MRQGLLCAVALLATGLSMLPGGCRGPHREAREARPTLHFSTWLTPEFLKGRRSVAESIRPTFIEANRRGRMEEVRRYRLWGENYWDIVSRADHELTKEEGWEMDITLLSVPDPRMAPELERHYWRGDWTVAVETDGPGWWKDPWVTVARIKRSRP